MSVVNIDTYEQASATLRINDLRQALYDEGAVLMEKVLVNLHGDEHRDRRSVENKVLRRDYFRYYEAEIFPTTLQQTIEPYLAAGHVDIVDFGFRVMMNLTADFSGIDRPLRTKEETEHLLRVIPIFGKAATLGQSTEDDKEGIKQEIRDALAEFDKEFFTPSMERRLDLIAQFEKGEIAEEELPRDVFVELLRNLDFLKLSREFLLKEVGFFVLAGAFTSIHAMVNAMHEIFTWMDKHPEDRERIETDDLFLQKCIYEAIRLHPSSPTAGRRATCPMHLDPADADITEDDMISIDLDTANRDTSVFGPDAREFNPHREVAKNTMPYGLSFGLGQHACIGLNLAAGALPRANTDPTTHQYGTISIIARTLLNNKARPDPDDPTTIDTTNTRLKFGRYPILLG